MQGDNAWVLSLAKNTNPHAVAKSLQVESCQVQLEEPPITPSIILVTRCHVQHILPKPPLAINHLQICIAQKVDIYSSLCTYRLLLLCVNDLLESTKSHKLPKAQFGLLHTLEQASNPSYQAIGLSEAIHLSAVECLGVECKRITAAAYLHNSAAFVVRHAAHASFVGFLQLLIMLFSSP